MTEERHRPPARRLVASYCFPPYSDVSAVVAAKRVRERNEPVDVVQNAMDSIRSSDEELTEIAGDLVHRRVALPSKTAFSSWTSIFEFQRMGLEVVSQWEREQGRPYESVYSRAQFAASHFLAARVKLSRPQLTWDAEFSDPLSHDVLGKERSAPAEDDELLELLRRAIEGAGFRPPSGVNALEWCEVVAFAFADSITFTNPYQRDFMLEHCADPALAARVEGIATVSPHPTLPRQFYSMGHTDLSLEEGRFHIGYFGNFYANRGIGRVVDALGLLGENVRDRLRLHIFTAQTEEVQETVDDAGLDGVVRVGPFVGFLEFLTLCDRMDLLLVTDAVSPPGGTNPFLPSKWSDYKGSVTPVWGIVEEDSALDEQALDFRTPVEHTSAAAQLLARLASR
ncbi:MAG TPA: hypothetical protein VJN29_11410 [Intrasporangium sp.]|uniref:hypothetical protein n=1 Tax=Intrasporangium sp. TaxID=1925024 RepID=UPI002B4910D6|nr:hypothetical protein [Intrasporangium sp.]HKX67823.1 hypothetical protein [Intrasporangium sp.]